MKILRLILFLVGFYLVTMTAAFAQTVIVMGPITTTDNVEWTIAPSDAASASVAQGMPIRVRDNGQPQFVTLNASGCVPAIAPAVGWTCTTKVTTALASTVNVRGSHSLVATWFDVAAGTESPSSIPFVLTVPAVAPTGVRIIR
jgi:hypothetical protein